MRAAALFAAALLAAGATHAQWLAREPARGAEKWVEPSFCDKQPCPPFTVDKKFDGYEQRSYEAGHWAVTNVTDTKYELAYTKAGVRLMRYFKGANAANEELPATTPTLALLKLSKDASKTKKDYAFSRWVQDGEDAPAPDSDDVALVKFPEVTGFVRAFSGFATEGTALEEVSKLHELLAKDEQDFDAEEAFIAVYDPPYKLAGRHNEVHVVKKGTAPRA